MPSAGNIARNQRVAEFTNAYNSSTARVHEDKFTEAEKLVMPAPKDRAKNTDKWLRRMSKAVLKQRPKPENIIELRAKKKAGPKLVDQIKAANGKQVELYSLGANPWHDNPFCFGKLETLPTSIKDHKQGIIAFKVGDSPADKSNELNCLIRVLDDVGQ